MIALMSPEDSWVARWQKISEYYFILFILSMYHRLIGTHLHNT